MLKEFRGHKSYVNCCGYVVLPPSALGDGGNSNRFLAVVTGSADGSVIVVVRAGPLRSPVESPPSGEPAAVTGGAVVVNGGRRAISSIGVRPPRGGRIIATRGPTSSFAEYNKRKEVDARGRTPTRPIGIDGGAPPSSCPIIRATFVKRGRFVGDGGRHWNMTGSAARPPGVGSSGGSRPSPMSAAPAREASFQSLAPPSPTPPPPPPPPVRANRNLGSVPGARRATTTSATPWEDRARSIQ